VRRAGEALAELTGGTLDLADIDRRYVVLTVRCGPPCSSLLGKVLRTSDSGLLWAAVRHLGRPGEPRRRALMADWLRDVHDHWQPGEVTLTCRKQVERALPRTYLAEQIAQGARVLVVSHPAPGGCMP
jgi:hypothetical protein